MTIIYLKNYSELYCDYIIWDELNQFAQLYSNNSNNGNNHKDIPYSDIQNIEYK